jgi:micrococcal nuclease
MRELYNYRAVCTRVIDGDTADLVIDVGFKMTTTQRVRLLGINTPERGQEGYQEAKDYLTSRILEKTLVISTRKSDVFGRYLGTIYVEDENVNEELLREGLAVVFMR